MSPQRRVSDADYARLLAVRTRLRAFEQWSAGQAAEHGLTAAQHQLLLAVRGHEDARGPTIREAAEYLFVRHNTAVELADRTEAAGLVRRVPDSDDGRVIRLRLTAEGQRRLRALSAAHISELARLRPLIDELLAALDGRG